MPLCIAQLCAIMVYVLEQRLRAQAISPGKTRRVLRDVASTMFLPRFVDELFAPQHMFSLRAVRSMFDRIAHSSICRLNESSMDKLFDLQTMTFKQQLLFTPPSMAGLVGVTIAHIDKLATIVGVTPSGASHTAAASTAAGTNTVAVTAAADDGDGPVENDAQLSANIHNYRRRIVTFYGAFRPSQAWSIRRALLSFVQERSVKVSLFLETGLQRSDGVIVLRVESSALPPHVEPPGVIRYFTSTGGGGVTVGREEKVPAIMLPSAAPWQDESAVSSAAAGSTTPSTSNPPSASPAADAASIGDIMSNLGRWDRIATNMYAAARDKKDGHSLTNRTLIADAAAAAAASTASANACSRSSQAQGTAGTDVDSDDDSAGVVKTQLNTLLWDSRGAASVTPVEGGSATTTTGSGKIAPHAVSGKASLDLLAALVGGRGQHSTAAAGTDEQGNVPLFTLDVWEDDAYAYMEEGATPTEMKQAATSSSSSSCCGGRAGERDAGLVSASIHVAGKTPAVQFGTSQLASDATTTSKPGNRLKAFTMRLGFDEDDHVATPASTITTISSIPLPPASSLSSKGSSGGGGGGGVGGRGDDLLDMLDSLALE